MEDFLQFMIAIALPIILLGIILLGPKTFFGLFIKNNKSNPRDFRNLKPPFLIDSKYKRIVWNIGTHAYLNEADKLMRFILSCGMLGFLGQPFSKIFPAKYKSFEPRLYCDEIFKYFLSFYINICNIVSAQVIENKSENYQITIATLISKISNEFLSAYENCYGISRKEILKKADKDFFDSSGKAISKANQQPKDMPQRTLYEIQEGCLMDMLCDSICKDYLSCDDKDFWLEFRAYLATYTISTDLDMVRYIQKYFPDKF